MLENSPPYINVAPPQAPRLIDFRYEKAEKEKYRNGRIILPEGLPPYSPKGINRILRDKRFRIYLPEYLYGVPEKQKPLIITPQA